MCVDCLACGFRDDFKLQGPLELPSKESNKMKCLLNRYGWLQEVLRLAPQQLQGGYGGWMVLLSFLLTFQAFNGASQCLRVPPRGSLKSSVYRNEIRDSNSPAHPSRTAKLQSGVLSVPRWVPEEPNRPNFVVSNRFSRISRLRSSFLDILALFHLF
ncbi:hypothetical protein E3N88_35953 [Mikania micrantha]|uniref:Uncharacterized protein n=1 Tax=Mikania micrantha TaxID=192012 RepID=A0A5N6M559_9ASTR|nr:hypothetical protein E3N88_35953 [Mikania micrantha]